MEGTVESVANEQALWRPPEPRHFVAVIELAEIEKNRQLRANHIAQQVDEFMATVTAATLVDLLDMHCYRVRACLLVTQGGAKVDRCRL